MQMVGGMQQIKVLFFGTSLDFFPQLFPTHGD